MTTNRDGRIVKIVGVPFDEGSSFLQGPAQAPPLIREALHSPSANLWTEAGHDLAHESRLVDTGDLALSTGVAVLSEIETGIADRLEPGCRLIALGGDHAVTHPIVRAMAAHHGALTILHLDAHPDLYDELDGNRHSHACPFARIMENGLASRLVQMGIRTMNGHQRDQVKRFGVEVLPIESWGPAAVPSLSGPVYLSLDLDVLDPAFAPGLSHHEPGGVSTRQLLEVIKSLRVDLVGADIVEYNPTCDLNGVTAMVAAKVLKEIVARMLPSSSSATPTDHRT